MCQALRFKRLPFLFALNFELRHSISLQYFICNNIKWSIYYYWIITKATLINYIDFSIFYLNQFSYNQRILLRGLREYLWSLFSWKSSLKYFQRITPSKVGLPSFATIVSLPSLPSSHATVRLGQPWML